jgi:predicted metal-dependent hydrolase
LSHKSQKIAALIGALKDSQFDPHYLGYFECFNQQLFFEAHEVLEELWLPQRGQPTGLFYKALIQLAGAFVHLQKKRPQPALALFKLAQDNLSKFPPRYESLDLAEVRELIALWMRKLSNDGWAKSLTPELYPNLSLRRDQP